MSAHTLDCFTQDKNIPHHTRFREKYHPRHGQASHYEQLITAIATPPLTHMLTTSTSESRSCTFNVWLQRRHTLGSHVLVFTSRFTMHSRWPSLRAGNAPAKDNNAMVSTAHESRLRHHNHSGHAHHVAHKERQGSSTQHVKQ